MDSHSSNTRTSEQNASDEDDKSIVSMSWIFRNDTNTPDYNWIDVREYHHSCGIYDDSEAGDTIVSAVSSIRNLLDDNSEAGGEEINHDGEEEVDNGNANDDFDSEDEENGNTGPVLGKRKASDI
jgi:hypothetical protein